jgi:NAD(P)-dependent dehydrogenase (short-subunit alcohol dehydrogenase family)
VTFAGRVAVVTGASSGVGKAIAMALIAAGVSVHALSPRPPGERADSKRRTAPLSCFPDKIDDVFRRCLQRTITRGHVRDSNCKGAPVARGGSVSLEVFFTQNS